LQLIFLLSLLFLTQNSYSQNVVRLYCFEGENLSQVSSYLKPILKSTDSINEIRSANCLEVQLSNVRIPLFDSWLSRRYKYRNDFSNLSGTVQKPVSSKNCRLELNKKTKSSSQLNSGNIGSKNNININSSGSSRTSRSRFLMMSGEPFSLRINDFNTYITCHKKSSGNYQIRISLSENKGALSTSVSLVSGQEVNVGSIVENLDSKSKNMNIQKGLGFQKSKIKSKSDFTLKIY
jgi:hypothetical protein